MTPRTHALAALTVSLAIGLPALAAEPDPARGRELARRWCADCHLVAPDLPGGDAGPAFATLARGRSPEALRMWLAEPHPPMPMLDIPEDAARDIAAHILSLADCRESAC